MRVGGNFYFTKALTRKKIHYIFIEFSFYKIKVFVNIYAFCTLILQISSEKSIKPANIEKFCSEKQWFFASWRHFGFCEMAPTGQCRVIAQPNVKLLKKRGKNLNKAVVRNINVFNFKNKKSRTTVL